MKVLREGGDVTYHAADQYPKANNKYIKDYGNKIIIF